MEQDRFSRLRLLIGAKALAQLHRRRVAVFGVGGVGSYAVEALARAGIGHLTLVDPDRIVSSNINRQLHALEQTLGQLKVEVMANRCRAIHPAMEIVTHPCRYSSENAQELLAPGFDYVLDCIDTITDKIDLIARCDGAGVPVISALGAANKIDPSRVRCGDLFATSNCRLARVLRKELRRRAVAGPIRAVYSTEEFRPLTHAQPQQRTAGGSWQRVPLGTLSTIPSLFGLMMAGDVLKQWLEAENE
ncbi:MAG: tRNA threonylcarbamoyladenosine dehydratase [Desulfuromonadaceae bacterium]|nr:tRNA threonylcarbamoyladenosine dehydratase [Desulfuromonadaceae bacterium]